MVVSYINSGKKRTLVYWHVILFRWPVIAEPQSGVEARISNYDMAPPEEYDLVITGGVCVTASDVAPLDIAVKDEKIVLLAPSGSLSHAKATRIIDAEGGYVTVSSSLSP